jgi:hypothetical protein
LYGLLKGLISPISPRWALILVASAFGIAAASVRAFESEESKARRAEQKRRKDLRVLADRIFRYGQTVHQQFPTGDVVVSERDLAEQLRKRADTVATALHILLGERKVQKAPLSGYWKPNNSTDN